MSKSDKLADTPFEGASFAEGEGVALILNVHARKYSRAMAKTVAELMPQAKLFVTHNLDEAKAAAKEIFEEKFPLVFSGGGDGTISGLLSMLRDKIDDHEANNKDGEKRQLPVVGVLKLGTGNGWATTAGIKHKLDLLRSLAKKKLLSVRDYRMVESGDSLVPFGGLGWDGRIINDYNRFKNIVRKTWFARYAEGLGGYLGAIATQTIPAELARRKRAEIRVERFGSAEVLIGSKTPQALSLEGDHSILYEGPFSLCGAGTIPYYGYKFKAFPDLFRLPEFSGKRFEFRVYNGNPLATAFRAPWIWAGRYRSPKLQGFLAEKVKLTFSEPMPMQLGGDAAGECDEVTFSLSDFSVPMLVRGAV